MTTYPSQQQFAKGEFTPRLHQRYDIDHYGGGARKILNWLTMRQGGVRRRPGFKFVQMVKSHANKSRLIPFAFNVDSDQQVGQAYILEFFDLAFRVFADGGIVPAVEVVLPYTEAQIADLHYTQSNDFLYFAHREVAPYKVTRTSNTAWTVTPIDFQDGPYLVENAVEATTLIASAATGTVTITASAVTGINEDQGFLATDVGRHVRIRDNTPPYWHWYKITGFTDSTNVTAEYQSGWNDVDDEPTAPGGPIAATEHWRLGAWSDTTGWPARVQFFEERLAWARTDLQPQTIWFSRAGDFENHRPGIKDDDAITATILAGQSNSIAWMAEAELLQIGTTGATRTMGQSTADTPFAPTNLKQKRTTTYRSTAVLPIQVGSVTLFVGAFGKSIREFVYSIDFDNFVAPDISVLSEHLFRSPIVEMAYQQDPDSIGWIVTEDGKMVAMTYERDQKMVSFTQQITDGEVESIASVPGTNRDEIWIVVKRTINGASVRYIEQLEGHFEDDGTGDKSSAVYMDSAISYSGVAANSFSGADHLEGETVQIFADGAVHPSVMVVGGIVTLPTGVMASTIHAGIGYNSELRTLSLSPAGRDGVMLGRRKRVKSAIVGVLETMLLKVGAGRGTFDALFRNTNDPMDAGPPLQTRLKKVGVDDSWEHDGSINLLVDTPTPATITMVAAATESEP